MRVHGDDIPLSGLQPGTGRHMVSVWLRGEPDPDDAEFAEIHVTHFEGPEWLGMTGHVEGTPVRFTCPGALPLEIEIDTDHPDFPIECHDVGELALHFDDGSKAVFTLTGIA